MSPSKKEKKKNPVIYAIKYQPLVHYLWVCLDKTYFVETETENWKYCSKIIFKCVNSTVGPIFNEKVTKK